MCTVCEPFPDLSSTIVSDIASFFEIFPSEDEDGDMKSISKQSSSNQWVIKPNPALQKVDSKKTEVRNSDPSIQVLAEEISKNVVHPIQTEVLRDESSSFKSNPIPITTQSNLRNKLVTRQKYVGNHFSDNSASLFHEVKMAPSVPRRTPTVNSTVHPHIHRNHTSKSTNLMVEKKTLKGINRSEQFHSPTRPKRIEEIRSPPMNGSKDPSQYVAAVMKFRSKSK